SWDIFVLKLDASGNFVWVKQMGGPSNEYGASLALDAANNIYVTGYFIGTPDMDPGAGTFTLSSVANGYDIFALKLDPSGNFGWARQMGGPGTDLGYEIAVDGSGNSYITGTFEDTCDFNPGPLVYSLVSKGYADAFIVKLNTAGNLVFAYQIGSSFTDYGSAVCVDPSGNCFVSGTSPDTIEVHSASGTYTMIAADGRDIYLANYSPSGNLIRCLQTGGPSFGGVNYMTTDPAGNIYLAGAFEGTYDFDPSPSTYSLTSYGEEDGFILKLDNSENFVWAKQIGGDDNDDCIAIAVNNGGDVVVAGTFKSTCDFDPGPSSYTYTEAGGIDAFVLKLTQSYAGIQSTEQETTRLIYPNPSRDKIYIKTDDETGPVQIILTNEFGQVCFEESFPSAENISLDLSKLSGSIYILEVKSAGGISRTKIVKQ
ncbi:MAG: SBBP repeat-containing protein, partial [Bacteroidia bacterium]